LFPDHVIKWAQKLQNTQSPVASGYAHLPENKNPVSFASDVGLSGVVNNSITRRGVY